MKRRTRLSDFVEDPSGRVDVALYRMADRVIHKLETEQGVAGLREHALPILEDLILKNVPAENMIPAEIRALLNICRLNQGKERK